jgi:predicted protein tyrosine phosphatase
MLIHFLMGLTRVAAIAAIAAIAASAVYTAWHLD